jgi:hypothetical protein
MTQTERQSMLQFTKDQRKAFDPKKLVKPMGKNRILVPQLEKAFVGFDDSWTFTYEPKRGDSAWHPSGHCTPDASQLYDMVHDAYHGYLDPDTTWVKGEVTGPQKSFMVGHYWHQLIQYVIVKIGLAEPEAIEAIGVKAWNDIAYQHHGGTPKPFHWVRGQGDIAPLVTPEWTGLVDIKTMNSNSFKGAVGGSLPAGFAHKYYCQIQIYMDLFDLDQALILGVNKDAPHDFCELTYVRNQDIIDAIYAKWRFVSDCLQRDIVPSSADDKTYALPTINEVNE